MIVRIELLRAFLIEDKHTPLAKKIFQTKEKFVVSAATLIQLVNDLEVRKISIDVLDKLKGLKTLKVAPVDYEIFKEAIKYKKKYNISIFDAIVVATCSKLKDKLLTLETFFDKVKEIERLDPFTFLKI